MNTRDSSHSTSPRQHATVSAAATVSRSAPLAGVPSLIKDVDIFASEWPTTYCSRFFASAQPRADSEIVQRWRVAGLIRPCVWAGQPPHGDDYGRLRSLRSYCPTETRGASRHLRALQRGRVNASHQEARYDCPHDIAHRRLS
jgi:hypothetical protein